MYRVTGNREAVEELLELTRDQLDTSASAPAARASGIAATGLAGYQGAAATLDEALDRLQNNTTRRAGAVTAGVTATPMQKRAPSTPYAPRDQYIALFQSAMDEYLEIVGASESDAPRGAAAAAGLDTRVRSQALLPFLRLRGALPPAGSARAADIFAQYGPLDPRWAEVVVEKMKVVVRGKHPFIEPSDPATVEFALDEKCKLAIVGDWGGGNEAAQAVAEHIAQLKPKYVIHLGDVYYAGTAKEVQDRFLKYWPAPDAPGRSFALNSNHEMYSGGYAYFELTLGKWFKQPASYFSLSNKYWRFLGLDTGYDEHDLHGSQVDWLRTQVARTGPRNVLLSHHQLFSAYETTDTSKLEAKVKDLLPAIHGWIWGHEHLAVVYQRYKGIKAICLGNGCFPYAPPGSQPTIPVNWLDTHQPQNADSDFPGGHTFALFTIDGPSIEIDLISEGGQSLHKETWS